MRVIPQTERIEPMGAGIHHIQPAGGRYVQIKAVLTGDSQGRVTPAVHSFTIGYNDDASAPDTGGMNLKGYSTTAKTAELAGVDVQLPEILFRMERRNRCGNGYRCVYVYLAQMRSDPATAGIPQQGRSYSYHRVGIRNVYYLKIKAKKQSRLFSSAAVDFSFTYEGISPVATATISTQAQWDVPRLRKAPYMFQVPTGGTVLCLPPATDHFSFDNRYCRSNGARE
jgi:hypothetical protein